MTLRTRMLLTLAGSGLAIFLGSYVAREIAIHYASEAAMHSSIGSRLNSLDRETCETGRDFERFRGARRPEEVGGPGGPGGGLGRPGGGSGGPPPFGRGFEGGGDREPGFRRPPPDGMRDREREAFGGRGF